MAVSCASWIRSTSVWYSFAAISRCDEGIKTEKRDGGGGVGAVAGVQ